MVLESVKDASYVLVNYWWVYFPVVFFIALVNIWGDYNRARYLASLKWVTLQIKFPREVAASFKAMEQVFATLHGVITKPSWDERFFGGKSVDWFSFEIVGSNGEVSFYIRTQEQHRNLVESNIYAQYPEAEISEADDYTQFLEGEAPGEEYDIFGMELILTKDNCYPLRTYEYFEEVSGGPYVPRVDPLASLSEILGSLKIGEHAWTQVVVSPAEAKWIEAGEKKIKEITEGAKREKKEKEEKTVFRMLTAQESFVAKAINNKISKLGFKSAVRFAYIAKKDIFSKATGAAVSGVFAQYAAPNLNGFKPNPPTVPKVKWTGFMKIWPLKVIPFPFRQSIEYEKKKNLFKGYIARKLPKKTIILNTEELATLYHLPSIEVKAPLLERIEARKGTPPLGLPVKGSQ